MSTSRVVSDRDENLGSSGHRWQVRVRGTVQGVGFRPTVWRLANEMGLSGEVLNDGEGVLIRLLTERKKAEAFVAGLEAAAPPLSSVESAVLEPLSTGGLALLTEDGALAPEEWAGSQAGREPPATERFRIVPSASTRSRTAVTPDASTCAACLEEVLDPRERRHRYPFTNCTHCGPRFSIVQGVPYDREKTTMSSFPMCSDCLAEYRDPADRRFHAQPIACPSCGPRAWLVRTDGRSLSSERVSSLDDVDAAAELLDLGEIVAIRGLGGFHLACDATNGPAVERLRSRKRRDSKPFALMARDLETIRAYCSLEPLEEELLVSSAAPIVLLDRHDRQTLPAAIAPGLESLGFMLPSTPLHHLMLRRFDRPLVMTSGNLSSEPQALRNEEAFGRLAEIADYALLHDRDIANRVDDSVVRVSLGRPRVLRRARGYAPRPLRLPEGLAGADGIVAFGGELKSTFCLVKEGQAVLSPHLGDLEEASTFDEYVKSLSLLGELFDHRASHYVADLHPEYLSSKLARQRSAEDGLPVLEVQHHHAHIVSCLVECGVPLDSRPVLGLALDGLGFGDDGTLWGGEFLLADYLGYRRLGTFKPVAMIGGAQAVYEPWRNTYAHLIAAMGWQRFATSFKQLELYRFLEQRPRAVLDKMLSRGLNCPEASSCGRLFDAFAAALGVCRERVTREGQAAMELEALVPRDVTSAPLVAGGSQDLYPFAIHELDGVGLPYIEPLGMWQAMLEDLALETDRATMAARFHRGLARALARMAARLLDGPVAASEAENTVALSGGCFQNRVLFELTVRELEGRGVRVLTHSAIPANDGGLSLGQAAIGAAQLVGRTSLIRGNLQ